MADPASLIFKDDRPADHMGVHAVVIGIGHYPHLPGGGGERYADHEGMVQISSPPHSAQQIAKWLFDTYLNDPNLPLRSLHLLESRKSGTAGFEHGPVANTGVPEALLANIKVAVRDWFRRGDGCPEGLLFFYFCGHGISAEIQHTLLASDFGADSLAPFETAINFTDFHLGMARCKAASKVFFVDACRTISQNLIEQSTYKGDPLIPGRTTVVPTRAPVFLSAQPGAKSFGLPNKPTAFAQALPLAFQGGAWDKVDGDWVVCTSLLRRALERQIQRVMRRFKDYRADVAGYADATMTIKSPSGHPLVPVDIGGRPDQVYELNQLSYDDLQGSKVVKDVNDDDIWLLDLAEGQYQFAARFKNTIDGAEKVTTLEKYVSPQNVSERLRP